MIGIREELQVKDTENIFNKISEEIFKKPINKYELENLY